MALLILSPTTWGWPLSRSLARTSYQSSPWTGDKFGVCRRVCKCQFTVSHPHLGWPQTKDEGLQQREGKHDEELQARESHYIEDDKIQGTRPANKGVSKRIHILGAGNLGLFVTHSLAGIPAQPPITLLLTRRQWRNFLDHDSSIDVTTRGMTERRRSFEVELLSSQSQASTPREDTSEPKESEITNSWGRESNPLPADTLRTLRLASQEQNYLETAPPDKLQSGIDNNVTEKRLHSDQRETFYIERSPDSDHQEGKELKEYENWSARAENEFETSRVGKDGSISHVKVGRGTEENDDAILNLIVTVKAHQTVRALQAVAHRLSRESTIMFLQNGMGILDEVNREIFSDEMNRPTYIVGIVSHGLYSNRNFSVVHAGEGTIALGVMPRMPMIERRQPENLVKMATSARYLLRTMTRTPVFVAVGFPPTDLFQQQLDKLAVNCIINPLTAVIDCKNGALLSNYSLTRVMRLLLAEISLVIRSLPELKNVPNVKMRFDPLRLERLVFSVANSTAGNNSSMLQDIRSGKQTEVDYINGYIVKRGEEMGVHCVMNYMLLHMIKGKRKIAQEQADVVPIEAGGPR